MRVQLYIKLLFILLLFGCTKKAPKPIAPNIIPKPLVQKLNNTTFILDEKTFIESNLKFKKIAFFLSTYFEEKHQLKLSTIKNKNTIVFEQDLSIENDEGYLLKVSSNKILITSKTVKGAFYAVQSLIQLLPVKTNAKTIAIQGLEIKDSPEFKYRGMHLDVARHFFSVNFIKKYIDLMSMLKMNTFHWHLTEDQGWRIEIKKYPKLQEIAAYRDETLVGHYSEQPQKFDGKKYGGYYTQKEIKEIVAYAIERQITVIPEIEMPGHSQAAIAAYPELGCTGEQVKVAAKWGVFDNIYCPKENTFKFLEDIIDEVVTLFPGKYIHIGGDEAPKTNWKKCTHCQQLIKKEGLKDENGLQSYFITRMEKYINSKGKQIIGWDEILEGGLAPNATVMSWRGTAGAVEAAKQKHNVILTPASHCYFDHYQSDNENEPLAIGGFLPLEKVYSFQPVPEELTEEEAKYVLGAQGNVWTEYITTPEKVEYMVFPRAVALAEAVWSTSENKNYDNFIKRLEFFNKRLKSLDVNYANHLYEIKGELINLDKQLSYRLETSIKDKEIRFTTDDSEPKSTSPVYNNPFKINALKTIKAAIFDKNGNQLGQVFEQKITLHKGVGEKITLNTPPNEAYNAGGKQALINGISGSSSRYGDKEWLGFSEKDVEITIDFDKQTKLNSIATRFYNGNGQWIYAPKEVNLEIKLTNGKTISLKNKVKRTDSLLVNFSLKDFIPESENSKVDQIKIIIPNYGIIPENKQGAGHKAWTFIDEIIIN